MSKACQLFSGSSGNSIYIASGSTRFLVDIGVSAKRCENALKEIDVDPSTINGIFLTHEHTDHTAGVRVFASRYDIPVFASPVCLDEMRTVGSVNNRVKVYPVTTVSDFFDAYIEPFKLSHDSVDCQGYKFTMPDGRKISVCTDTGYVTPEAKSVLPGSDLIFLESNHEPSMVETGPYTYMLKKRILSDTGHLSNSSCAEFAAEMLKSGTTRFVLSHLSRENNMPSIARQTTVAALSDLGAVESVDYRLQVSAPVNEGRCIVL